MIYYGGTVRMIDVITCLHGYGVDEDDDDDEGLNDM